MEKFPLRIVFWAASVVLGLLPLFMAAIAFNIAERRYVVLLRPELVFFSVPIFIGVARDFALADISATPRLVFVTASLFGLGVTGPLYLLVRLAEIQGKMPQIQEWVMVAVPAAAILISLVGQLILADIEAK